MAQEAITVYGKSSDRRSSTGATNNYPSSPAYYSGSPNFIRASVQTDQRKYIQDLNRDIHQNLGERARRSLSTTGEWLYCNNAIVRAAIREMAYYSVGTWIAQYYGRNKAWGDNSEAVLFEHDKICNLDGGNMLDYLTNMIKAVYALGDIATVYTETETGYPALQLIGGHRIRTGNKDPFVTGGGPFDGAPVIDGVAVDGAGRPLAYRVWTDDAYEHIPASGMMLHFIREWPGQLRGVSQVAYNGPDLQDIREISDNELMGIKQVSSQGFIIHNENGGADRTKEAMRAARGGGFDSDGNKTDSFSQIIDGLQNRYFRAGSMSKLEELKSDRPSVNSQEFKKQIAREVLNALGWSYDFTLDSSKVGGAQMRIVVEKINKTIDFIQDALVRPASNRFNFYRISKLIKRGDLAPDVDSWKFDHQGPARITADEKYSSDVAIQEIRSGIKSPQKACAERGEYLEDVQDQAIAARKRFEEKCKAAGVDPDNVIWPTPNGPQPEPAQPKAAE